MIIMAVKSFFTYVAEIFNVIGLCVIVLGIIYSTIHYGLRFTFAKSKHHSFKLAVLRSEMCNSIILGLDFMVAATVIESVISPGYQFAEDYHSLGLVALMILVRIGFSYYLAKELEVLGLAEKKAE
ncbi:MAG TPA: DUF1622 domain-containing protein [Candidatus Babeliales bacterium]|nr:DUF1622 domain-containing protein [Candidatus Babeliales bacterium]